MYHRNRRGESSRRGEGIGSSLDRAGSSIVPRRSMGGKLVEADGAPLVDTEALRAMIRLLRVVQVLICLNRIVSSCKKYVTHQTIHIFINLCLLFISHFIKDSCRGFS